MWHLVDNGDGSGVQHWEGSNDPEHGVLPQNLDVGVSDSYMPASARLEGQKNSPMPFLHGPGNPGSSGQARGTNYVPLPGEDENHTAGN